MNLTNETSPDRVSGTCVWLKKGLSNCLQNYAKKNILKNILVAMVGIV